MPAKRQKTDFHTLVAAICQVHTDLTIRAGRAVNISLTLRNWAIGAHIAQYELRGADRARYGDTILERLAEELSGLGVSTCGKRQLYNYLKFYQVYPEIVWSAPAQFKNVLPTTLISDSQIVRTVSAQFISPDETGLIYLSYSHLELLTAIDDSSKRHFYEVESTRGNWSVRELKRQIGSLFYERSGLSANARKLSDLVQTSSDQASPGLAIRDPYIFEFLGLHPQEVMYESDLENALLAKLQNFLLELGHGFCFEARQKRILIGDTYGFVDLVFYHRILKCHVLIDLKIEGFSHENLGQLNTYVSWYRKNVMADGDNPPVGLLLCTQKDHALVEYALAGMDNSLFVSKYELALPNKADIQRFIEDNIRGEINT